MRYLPMFVLGLIGVVVGGLAGGAGLWDAFGHVGFYAMGFGGAVLVVTTERA